MTLDIVWILKIKKLGWKPKMRIEDKIQNINNWYKKNINRFKNRFEWEF